MVSLDAQEPQATGVSKAMNESELKVFVAEYMVGMVAARRLAEDRVDKELNTWFGPMPEQQAGI